MTMHTSDYPGNRRSSLLVLGRTLMKDRVLLALGFGFVALLVLDSPQAATSLIFTGQALLEIAPFLLLAVGFAAYAQASGFDKIVARAFSSSPAIAILTASIFGALSPFCSCGVIPLIAGLLGAGVPLGPVMAFWIASPIMDPEMFLLTLGGISSEFAIAKTFAAVLMGLSAGFLTHLLDQRGLFSNPLIGAAASCCSTSCSTSKAEEPRIIWSIWQAPDRLRAFGLSLRETGWFLLRWLTLAFFLESLMVAYVPSDLVLSVVGPENPFAIILAALIGMPSYLNGYAAIPLVSGLMDLGMADGPALAFMTAGAVSSIPAAIAVYSLVRLPIFFTYLACGLAGAIVTGYAYQAFVLF
ncbi:permease [Coralliovum pocilloporae]|uniref:permease n=1 Tax=Coralliovum pocilloporae TaxID=3066369 RepID=UPI003306C5F7